MIRGVVLKSAYETWAPTLGFLLAFGMIEGLLAFALPSLFETYADQILQLDFARRIVGALLGVEIGETIGAELLQSFPWVHPIALIVVWGYAIWFGTRWPAGEVEHGTIDVMMAFPVRREVVLASDGMVGLTGCLGLGLSGVVCNKTGLLLAGVGSQVSTRTLLLVAANLFCLALCVLGIATFFSTISSRRGRAAGASAAVVVASFTISFLAPFWSPARTVSFLGLLDYFRPLEITRTAGWPVGDLAVLTSVGATGWLAAVLILRRRDLCAG